MIRIFVAFSAWLVAAAIAVGCSSEQSAPEPRIGMANPASVYCIERGGRLEIVQEARGERGICVLTDGTRVDEWELFRRGSAKR